ncbi:unnamed protein product [marine sediment metagenome]|uniref:Uncharacterized protein n=1 Tax=marine sediment metagenome TaxID=412755 RepID=X1SSN7_9ZZZZ
MNDIDEQFNVNVSKAKEKIAKARKNRIPTDSDINEDNIEVLFNKIKTLETEVKKILDHLGI